VANIEITTVYSQIWTKLYKDTKGSFYMKEKTINPSLRTGDLKWGKKSRPKNKSHGITPLVMETDSNSMVIPRKSFFIRCGSFAYSRVLPYIPRPRTLEKSKSSELYKMLLDSSKTYAFAIPMLPDSVKNDVTTTYLLDRYDDIWEDTKLDDDPAEDRKKTKKTLDDFINVLEVPNESKIADIEVKFNELASRVTHTKHRKLLPHVRKLIYAIQDFPDPIKDDVIRYAKSMIIGITDSNITDIKTIEDHNRYIHRVAGLVGYQVTRIFQHRKELTEKQANALMPHPGLYQPGKNPANDFALAVQKVNDLKDFFEDYDEGIRRWPSEIIEKHGFIHDTLANVDPRNKDEVNAAYGVLQELVDDAVPMFKLANNYIEGLPHKPEGLRIFCGAALGMSAAALRSIQTRDFFRKKGKIRSKFSALNESYDVCEVVTYMVKNKENLGPFINHVLEKPSTLYGRAH